MMDRDGRLLETWGGRRGWNSSSCFYLLHTHVPLHTYSWLARMCAQPKPLLTLTPPFMHAHVHMLTRDLPELNALACLCVGGCRVLLQRGLHLLSSKHGLFTPTPVQSPR